MKNFIDKYSNIIIISLLIVLFFRTCGSDSRAIIKEVKNVSTKIDNVATHDDIKLEGLKAEKRMIQSTDRKILDVNRQAEIDKEVHNIEK